VPFLQSSQKTGFGLFSAINPFLTLTYVNSVDANTTTILTHPTNVQVGDVCVLLQFGYDNDAEFFSSTNTPTGFTSIVATPNITGDIQTSMNVSFRVLTSTANVTLTQPGMDNYGHVAIYYRLSNGTLQGTTVFSGTSSVVSGSSGATTVMPAASSNLAYLSFMTTSSFNVESIPFASGVSFNLVQYGGSTPAFATFAIGVSYGPQPQATGEGEGFDTSASWVGITSGRIGFAKAGV
jgi:hypothetical protein